MAQARYTALHERYSNSICHVTQPCDQLLELFATRVHDTRCQSRIVVRDDGLLEFHEQWEWESQPGTGTSVVRELTRS